MSFVLKAMMSVKSINVSYSRNEELLARSGHGPQGALCWIRQCARGAGPAFLLGQQNTDLVGNRTGDFALDAASRGWLSDNPYQNQTYQENYSANLNVRAQLEPSTT